MFSTNSSKICCCFVKKKIFEKSKMAAKMAHRAKFGRHIRAFCDSPEAFF